MSEEDGSSKSTKDVDNKSKLKKTSRKSCRSKVLKSENTENKEVSEKKGPSEVSCKCQFSCNCLTLECRKKLYQDFCNIKDYEEQQNYLKKLIRISAVNRRRYGNYEDPKESRRKRTFRYYFIIKGQSEVQVCQKTFCKTFGISPSRVQVLSKKIFCNETVKEIPRKRWVW